MFFCGDLIPGTPWVHVPITMGYDRFPELLIDEKVKLYESAEENWRYFFTHDPGIAMSSIGRNDKGKFAAFESHSELKAYEI